jgi:hypothetical protein
MTASLATTIADLEERSVRPDHVEIEFGLKFSAQGNVIVAAAAGEASLRVMVAYERAGSNST